MTLGPRACIWFRALLGTLTPVKNVTTGKRRFPVHLLLAATLLVGACSSGGGETSTTTAPPSTSTSQLPVSTAETLPPGLDQAVVDQLTEEINALVAATEQLRGLTFVAAPELRILPRSDFDLAVQAALEAELVKMDPATAVRLYRMLGLMDSDDDLGNGLFLELAQNAVVYYDQVTGEFLVAGDTADLTPYQRSTIVHELVHVLTEQYFRSGRTLTELIDEGSFDHIDAYRALVEGDATYFQFLYLQGLPSEDQADAAREALETEPVALENSPAFVGYDLLFPYEEGMSLVTALVAGGGIAAVDRAYVDFPVSTEQVLHIERYRGGEAPRRTDPVVVDLPEYAEAAAGTWGELGMIRLLTGVLTPGLRTQTADGWGGDTFSVMAGGSDVAFILRYRGDTEDDAIEVAEAMIAAARTRMGAGDGLESGGGVEFDADGPYVFVDRVDDGLVLIVATDSRAGRTIREQVDAP